MAEQMELAGPGGVPPADDADGDRRESPYRGSWQDDAGMCSTRCPACEPTGPTFGNDAGYHDCLITRFRTTPGVCVCTVFSLHDALRRGPGGGQ